MQEENGSLDGEHCLSPEGLTSGAGLGRQHQPRWDRASHPTGQTAAGAVPTYRDAEFGTELWWVQGGGAARSGVRALPLARRMAKRALASQARHKMGAPKWAVRCRESRSDQTPKAAGLLLARRLGSARVFRVKASPDFASQGRQGVREQGARRRHRDGPGAARPTESAPHVFAVSLRVQERRTLIGQGDLRADGRIQGSRLSLSRRRAMP